jgi:hypothetical protein
MPRVGAVARIIHYMLVLDQRVKAKAISAWYAPQYPTAVPLLPPTVVVAGGQTVRHCVIREEPAGLLIDASTKEPFNYKVPCVELNPHVGFNPAAAEAAKMLVKQFLKTLFKP